jgi:ferredoxin
VGAHSWKNVLFPSEQLLWAGHRAADDGFVLENVTEGAEPGPYGEPPYALLGVRSCDLHAIAIHDRVLRDRAVRDEHYRRAREATFVIGVGCSDPAGTCFCVSMGTGPRPVDGFDLALTEIETGPHHRLLVEVGSSRGLDVLEALPHTPAADADLSAARRVTDRAAAHMGRQLDTEGIKDLLYGAVESPRWDEVAARCLSCGNCTAVCPTCFCTSVEEHTDLTGEAASRTRVWDSCFSGEYSQLHGGSVRASIGSRYRQWATHKLGSWIDQFGTSGCVGCGRCVTWCPAAIDLTAEVAALRAEAAQPGVGST